MIIREACVETIEHSLIAQSKGADRIELCASLDVGGLTPPVAVIEAAANDLNVPVRVMIRERAGDFIYSDEEIAQMKESIDVCKAAGVEGVVFGACTLEESLDLPVIDMLAAYAQPMKVTIHKAIDTCKNPVEEVRRLKSRSNVHAILTSGKSATADEGAGLIKAMVSEAREAIEIIACGKVTDKNVEKIKTETQASAFHGRLIVGVLK